MTGKEDWIVEIGDPNVLVKKDDEFLIKENTNNVKLILIFLRQPIFIRKDTNKEFQYRVRNLNYDKSNFIVECDKTKQELVIKTLNKKYFKRFDIPDLKRLNIPLDESNLKVNFQNNTLVISVNYFYTFIYIYYIV